MTELTKTQNIRNDLKTIFIVFLICSLSAGTLAMVYALTKKPIENSIYREKMKALRQVLPDFAGEPAQNSILVENQEKKYQFYKARNQNGDSVGAALEVRTMDGYSGLIRIMLGVDASGRIHGVYILEHRETPGLGSKICNPEFLDQFKGKSLRNFTFAVEKDGGDVDAVTSATISSRAVTEALKTGLQMLEKMENVADMEPP